MIDFKDDNGVWDFGTVVSDEDCAAQMIKESVMLQRGEYFLDVDRGVDWIKYINSPTIDEDLMSEIKSDVRRAILDTSLVKDVEDITIEKKDRKITISYVAVLKENEQEISDSFDYDSQRIRN